MTYFEWKVTISLGLMRLEISTSGSTSEGESAPGPEILSSVGVPWRVAFAIASLITKPQLRRALQLVERMREILYTTVWGVQNSSELQTIINPVTRCFGNS